MGIGNKSDICCKDFILNKMTKFYADFILNIIIIYHLKKIVLRKTQSYKSWYQWFKKKKKIKSDF